MILSKKRQTLHTNHTRARAHYHALHVSHHHRVEAPETLEGLCDVPTTYEEPSEALNNL